MMNPKTSLFTSGALLAGLLVGLTGCMSEPEPEPVVQRTYVPQPTEPELPPVTPIHELMEQLRIDNRIVMREDAAPDTDAARKAVLEFFDAFARGDSRALSGKLMEADRRELQALVESGAWEASTRGIMRIEVQTGMSSYGECAIALFEGGGDYHAQLWYYVDEGERFVFDAAATPPNMVSKLSGTDWIAAWHAILDEEHDMAFRPDTPVQMPQRNLDESRESPGGGSPTPSAPSSPGTPDGPLPFGPGG